MKGYKGFEPGLICKGKQYAENTVFEEPDAKICENGMHFCENPFDVLDHYDLVGPDGSFNEFAPVEALADCKSGHGCTAKAKKGCWITLSEWEYDKNKKLKVPVCVKTEYVDGERIKEDVFYKLENGEFKEVAESK